MFSRKNSSALSQFGKSSKKDGDLETKLGDSKSEPGIKSFRKKNKDKNQEKETPSNSETFKEKMIKKHMEKLAAKMKLESFASGNFDGTGAGTEDRSGRRGTQC